MPISCARARREWDTAARLCKVDVVNGEMRIARSVHARLRESMALYLHIAWCNGKLHLLGACGVAAGHTHEAKTSGEAASDRQPCSSAWAWVTRVRCRAHLGSPHSWYPTSRCAHRPFEIEAHVPPVCDTQHIAVGPNASLRQLGLPVFPGVPGGQRVGIPRGWSLQDY